MRKVMKAFDEEDVMKSGAVTFLDVLGWKGIWQKDKKALSKLKDIVRESSNIADEYTKKLNKKYAQLYVNKDTVETKVVSISDTIVLLSIAEAEVKDTIELHAQICSRIIEYALSRGIPLRGAISYGKFNESDRIMVGPAIDEAAAWHESTDWIGVVLTPTAQFYLENILIKNVITYKNIPFKKGIRGLNKCVSWDFKDKERLNELFIDKGPHMQEIAPKYLNTIEYLNRDKKQDRSQYFIVYDKLKKLNK